MAHDPTTDEAADDRDDTQQFKSITIKLSEDDLAALHRVVKRRYPKDTNRMTQTLRDLIREEDARQPDHNSS